MLWLIFTVAVWLLLLMLIDGYDLQISGNRLQVMSRVVSATLLTGLIYLFIFFIFGRQALLAEQISPSWLNLLDLSPPPRLVPALLIGLGLPLLLTWRLAYIRLFNNPALRHRAVIVGAGETGSMLVRDTQQATAGYEYVGFIERDPTLHDQTVAGIKVLGGYDVLDRLVRTRSIDEVIVAVTNHGEDRFLKSLALCHEYGVKIRSVANIYEEVLGQVPVEHLGPEWFVDTFNSNFPTVYRLFKRLLDIIVGLVGMAGLALIFPFIALAIYLDSPGPIFYRQERHGRYGRRFYALKFRSMIPNAEKIGLEKLGLDKWTEKNDPRITRVGRLIRKARIDELPQVWNILKGDMSVVGPRPEVSRMVERLEREVPYYRLRFGVKPGLTGWAQVRYRYGATIEDQLAKLRYDLYYIKHQSLVLDLLIIIRTLRVVLSFRGV
ncbi:MAG: sugar transferase [Oscillochloridaceae bacterium]|nr:sugar transferase [Chloroflexaceae bacterium]MDW8388714.1 sugar transferase [Oscillochloridaceae bacterium]